MKCSQCGREFDLKKEEGRMASISGSIMGDEYIETYYYCDQCGQYTVEVYHDRFLGEEDISIRGPLSKEEGDRQVELIKKCSEPWDKKCRCEAHKEYFGNWLD
ncbi:MAG: hypothetical protein QG657_4714 [Acidobacteriota bacterium]|nr:hypothetical protein [Acidobacteriota bacterium]